MNFKRNKGNEQQSKGKTKNALELNYGGSVACCPITHYGTLKKLYEYKRVIVSKVLILFEKICQALQSLTSDKVNLTDLIKLHRLVNQIGIYRNFVNLSSIRGKIKVNKQLASS